MLSTPELTGCWPLGWFTDPDGDDDEEYPPLYNDPISLLDSESDEDE